MSKREKLESNLYYLYMKVDDSATHGYVSSWSKYFAGIIIDAAKEELRAELAGNVLAPAEDVEKAEGL